MKSNRRMNEQNEKGKSPQIQQLPLAPMPHRNQQLFSDHYLDKILPERSDWLRLTEEAEGGCAPRSATAIRCMCSQR
jgi:hypothetical protein